MSAVRSVSGPGGKDVLLTAPEAEFKLPAEPIALPPVEREPGLILPDGNINWACPCLGGMAAGPCGDKFREAFSCFHYSTAEPKGSECYDKFSMMQQCMGEFPELYGRDDDDDDDGDATGDGGGDKDNPSNK